MLLATLVLGSVLSCLGTRKCEEGDGKVAGKGPRGKKWLDSDEPNLDDQSSCDREVEDPHVKEGRQGQKGCVLDCSGISTNHSRSKRNGRRK